MKDTRNPLVTEPLDTGNGHCTQKVRIRPIRGNTLIFWRDDGNEGDAIVKTQMGRNFTGFEREGFASLVTLNGRSWWECYWYDTGMRGWVCERDNVYLRLGEKDFQEVFGYIPVIHQGKIVNEDLVQKRRDEWKQKRGL